MTIVVDIIDGIAVGIEYVAPMPSDGIPHTIILDVVFLRFLFMFD